MRDAEAAEIARQVLYQPTTVIVVKPILQIMQTREIFASTFAAAIAVELDIVQQPFRSPIRFWLIQHPGEAERDFEKSPTIHALKIHRWRLDPVIDFECEMFVARADQRLANHRRTFTDRKRLPIPRFGLRNQPIELVLSFKHRAERQARFHRWRPRTDQNKRN